jgi:UDP-2-acetamido-3-amino-2,3-dideoxy-glucuronate N-acetyltransferase
MRDDVRVAIIGAGYWGSTLLRAFTNTEGIFIKTVCDTHLEALKTVKSRYPAVSLETSLENVLRDTASHAIIVATPPSSHFAIAQAALLAGKHVWVEKPLALRYTDGQRLVTIAREMERVLFVDETFVYDPLVEQARSWIASGAIGRPYHVSLERTGMGRIRRDSNVWWNSAPHDVSVLRYVLNSCVNKISVTGHAFLQSGIEDVVWASLQLERDVSAHLYLHWLFPEKKAPLMIVGESGMLHYEGRFEKRSLTRYEYRLGAAADNDGNRTNVIPIEQYEMVEEINGDQREPLALACAAFREHIRRGIVTPSSGEHTLHTLAVLEAGAQSLTQHGTWIDIPSRK